MKRYISWRRVSTQKQNRSGLGLEAQKDIINYFVESNKGELIEDYCECYTGTDLKGCTELRKAISHCKEIGACLIIAKTDRFRNTIEALQIYEEMGDGNICFCDLPHTDKFTLTLFFSLAEREALLISIRTKAALKAKKERGEVWNTDRDISVKAAEASAKARRTKSLNNENNIRFAEFIEDWIQIHGEIDRSTDWQSLVAKLNKRGLKTSSGLEFDEARARAMLCNLKRMKQIKAA
ncbi:MAG: recombinase family protein [Bacteroidales bacterium]